MNVYDLYVLQGYMCTLYQKKISTLFPSSWLWWCGVLEWMESHFSSCPFPYRYINKSVDPFAFLIKIIHNNRCFPLVKLSANIERFLDLVHIQILINIINTSFALSMKKVITVNHRFLIKASVHFVLALSLYVKRTNVGGGGTSGGGRGMWGAQKAL